MGIQIYDQISSPRIWSKVKLHHSILLRFGLKEGKISLINWKQMQPFRLWFHQVCLRSKIAQNPLKVCMHGYLANGYLNSLSNFSYKKDEKITSLRSFLDQPWIKTKIAPNIMKVSMHSYLPNPSINLRLNFNFEKLVKRETSLCSFDKVGLKGGENILECLKILYACLFIKWESKFMIKFKF